MEHTKYMMIALNEAKKAYQIDEVPIGAIVVKDGKVISKARMPPSNKACAVLAMLSKSCTTITGNTGLKDNTSRTFMPMLNPSMLKLATKSHCACFSAGA